jgi:ATP-dependent Clp protease adaptor protein ClpS
MSNEDNHDHDKEWHGENELTIAPSKPELKEPPKYRVLMLNDDYTPMDFVIEVLEGLFAMERDRATRTMLQVHTEGQALCGIFTFEIAEAKVEQANSYAQQHGHPLQCTMEEE